MIEIDRWPRGVAPLASHIEDLQRKFEMRVLNRYLLCKNFSSALHCHVPTRLTGQILIGGLTTLSLTSLQLMYPQGTHSIQHGQNHDADIGENRSPHVRDAKSSQRQAPEFNNQSKHNILIYNAGTLA